MSEWLSTGEMIDRLKVGEVAEVVGGGLKGWKAIGTVNGIKWTELIDGISEIISLSPSVIGFTWRILPKYVTFEEAKKSYEEGKEVKCTFGHFGDMGNESTETYSKSIPEAMGAISWYLIIKGKWEIIE